MYRAAATAEVMRWRRRVLAALFHSIALKLDVAPTGLTRAVVNAYLSSKARHLLWRVADGPCYRRGTSGASLRR